MRTTFLAAATLALTACQLPASLQPRACDLADEYTLRLADDVNWCKTDNCVAWYVQREAQQRALCAGIPEGVAQ